MESYQCGRDCWKCRACKTTGHRGLSRREFLSWMARGCIVFGGLGALAACGPVAALAPTGPITEVPQQPGYGPPEDGSPMPPEPVVPESDLLPTAEGVWAPATPRTGRVPRGVATVEIKNIGEFSFDAGGVRTLRPDIFQEGHFSLFDVLVHLSLFST